MARDRRVPGPADGDGGPARGAYQLGPHIFQRGEVWWAYIPGTGRRSLRTADRRTADLRLRELLVGGGPASLVAKPVEEGLSAIGKKYIEAPHGWTRSSMRTTGPRVLRFVMAMEALGVRMPSQITPVALNTWRGTRTASASRGTINRDEAVAIRMMRWAREQGLCGRTPIEDLRKLKEPKRIGRRTLPTPADVIAIADDLRAHEEPLVGCTILAGLVSGFRLDELLHVQSTDLHDDAAHVTPESGPTDTAWTTKGYMERGVRMSPEAVRVVEQFIATREATTNHNGTRPGLTSTWMAEHIDAARARLQPERVVPKFRAHDLRRLFATVASRGGIPITQIAAWLGHVDTATTERYIGVFASDAQTVAPTVEEIVRVYKTGGETGSREAKTKPATDADGEADDVENDAVEVASPGRIELPTFGLGSRSAAAESLAKGGGLVQPCTQPRADVMALEAIERWGVAEFERTGRWS